MGGMVAQELAHAVPERVKSLALMVTTPGLRAGILPKRPQISAFWAFLKCLFFATPHRVTSTALYLLFPEEFLNQYHRDNVSVGNILYSHLRERMKQRKAKISGFIGQYAACMIHYMSKNRLAKVRESGFPIVVIGAKKDRLLHPDNSKHLYKHLKSDLTQSILFEEAGHDVHVQQRSEIAHLLHDHFQLSRRIRRAGDHHKKKSYKKRAKPLSGGKE
jgi:pimeloyl-ACP methyl ester carboxylesterase